MTLQIGYKASAEQFAPRQLADYAVLAEELGFDSVAVSDHLQSWRHDTGHGPNALVWLGHVGARTERVRLGTSVVTPTFRYHPTVIAHVFATLECLHPGRMFLGVGTGEAINEVAATGTAWPEFRERFARLREAVRLMRALWTDERVTVEGEHFTVRDLTLYDRPPAPPPVYVAAGGPVVARYAGRAGDGFICTSGKGHDLYADSLLPAVAEGLDKAGRDHGAIDRMIEIKVSYDENPARALEDTRFWAPLSLSAEQKHGLTDPRAMEAAADALPIEQVARRWIVSSDPHEVAAQIGSYVDLGFDHLMIHAPGHDQERFLRAFARDVMPLLRTASDATMAR